MTKETSQKIKNMGFVCTLLIVSFHINWHENASPLLWWGKQLICEGVARIAVPFFFAVSGYFLAAHFDEDGWWKREVGKRIKSLVVPFYLWSFIFFATLVLHSIIDNQIVHRPFGAGTPLEVDWLQLLGLDFCHMPTLYPLWYVRCLFLFVLTGAIFKWGTGKAKWWWVLIVLLLHLIRFCILGLLPENLRTPMKLFSCYGYSISGVFYFSVGILVQRIGFPRFSEKIAYMSLVTGLLLLGLKIGFLHSGHYISSGFNSVVNPFLLYSIYHFMPTKAWPNWLTSCAFPIFLMHPITFQYLGIVQKYVPPICAEAQTLIQFVGGATVPIAVAVLLRRFLPKTASVLFGGR